MWSLRNIPIRRKLMLVITLTSAVALFLACTGFIVYQLATFWDRVTDELSTLADVVAVNSSAALIFHDREAAQENLATLSANPEIIAASVYDGSGEMFARYVRSGAQNALTPARPSPDGSQIEGTHLTVFRPVALAQDRIGTIYLRCDLRQEYAVARGFAIITLLVMVVSLLAAGLLSSVLQREISSPILNLARVAREIKETQDYSLRAAKYGEDELGDLIERFNEMLSEIQSGKAALLAINDTLRGEVVERERAEKELRKLNETLEQRVADRSAALAQRAVELRRSEAQLQEAQEIAHIGSWEWDIVTNRLSWSDELIRIYGIERREFAASYRAFLERVHPDDRERVADTVRKGYQNAAPFTFEHRIIRPDGQVRTLHCQGRVKVGDSGQPIVMVGTGQDITERKQAEQALARRTEELARSNAELERFGYVASHDLKEPLRMVHSYVELLSRRYRGHIDSEADKYISYAMEGTLRMRQLITDLLVYSQAGAHDKPLEPTQVGEALSAALANLSVSIEGSGAQVTSEELPTLLADRTQLVQLFQNLIGNAIKFVKGRTPRIHVGVVRQSGSWCFSVRDNGIGIDPEYYGRIFGVFQRLHNRKEYPGTGIGLAICKKVIERHGGRIWLESKSGEGTTFLFTLADSQATASESQLGFSRSPGTESQPAETGGMTTAAA